jgi:nucleoside-diphosphate-sugar epimerase
MKIVITGSKGFIGTHLCKALSSHADVGAYLESEGDLFSTVARGRSFIVMAGL